MTKNAKATGTNGPGKSKMPAGEVLDLVGLVSYAEESIVSRTLVENKAVTITLLTWLLLITVPFVMGRLFM